MMNTIAIVSEYSRSKSKLYKKLREALNDTNIIFINKATTLGCLLGMSLSGVIFEGSVSKDIIRFVTSFIREEPRGL